MKQGILFVVPWRPTNVGGVNQVVLNLLKESFADKNYIPILFIPEYKKRKLETIKIQEYRALSGRIPSLGNKKISIWVCIKFFINFLYFCKSFDFYVKTNNIRVVNFHFPSINALAFLLYIKLFNRRLKCILSFHGADIDKIEHASGASKFLWKILLKYTDYYIFCSENLKKRFLNNKSAIINKCKVIHNGIDEKTILTSISKKNIDHIKQPYLINIATFEYKKGQDVLIKAFANLSNEYPDLHLILVGRNEKYIDSLKNQVKQLDIKDKVIFHVDLNHEIAMHLLSKARLFILPSRIEPFGIVLLEAGILQIPVVASKVGGIPEIIENKKNGLLVESENTTELANAIKELLSNNNLEKYVIKNFKQDIQKRFSWKKTYDNYKLLF